MFMQNALVGCHGAYMVRVMGNGKPAYARIHLLYRMTAALRPIHSNTYLGGCCDVSQRVTTPSNNAPIGDDCLAPQGLTMFRLAHVQNGQYRPGTLDKGDWWMGLAARWVSGSKLRS